jgi:hypothetical protein
MCNPSKIASLLTPACVLLVAATILFSSVIAAGTSWWTSAAGTAEMLIAAGVLVAAFALINAAAMEAAKCASAPCKTFGDRLYVALITLSVSVATMAASAVVFAFPAGFPWGASVIGAIFLTMATIAAVTLFYISASVLRQLDTCLATASTAVAVQTVVGIIAAIVILAASAGGSLKLFGAA